MELQVHFCQNIDLFIFKTDRILWMPLIEPDLYLTQIKTLNNCHCVIRTACYLCSRSSAGKVSNLKVMSLNPAGSIPSIPITDTDKLLEHILSQTHRLKE